MFSKSILDLIGDTPLVKLDNLNPNPGVNIYAKLELCNPSGSMKDRIALYMIEEAEKRGEIRPDHTIIEATSGNTGISLGMVCAVKGYRCNFLMLETKSLERRMMLRYWGAELTLTSADDPDSHIYLAKEMVEKDPDKYFYINQNENEDNVLAHYHGTGQEIVKELDGNVDMFVAGFGTGGTLMGVGRVLRETGTGARHISVEPRTTTSNIDGLKYSGEGYMPSIYESDLIDETVRVDDEVSFECARLLAQKEGVLAGISAGATVWTALEFARKMRRGNIVVILADRGERYFSTPLFKEARADS